MRVKTHGRKTEPTVFACRAEVSLTAGVPRRAGATREVLAAVSIASNEMQHDGSMEPRASDVAAVAARHGVLHLKGR